MDSYLWCGFIPYIQRHQLCFLGYIPKSFIYSRGNDKFPYLYTYGGYVNALNSNGVSWIAGQLAVNIPTGTSPFAITSTTLNTNLNADLLDGQHGSYYQTALGFTPRNPADDITLANSKNVILDQIPATDHNATGIKILATAGEALVYGNVCYLGNTTKYFKAKGDSTATMPAVAMALGTISANATGYFLLQGFFRDDSTSGTSGKLMWVSEATAGLWTTTQPATTGNQIQAIGQVYQNGVYYFNPSYVVVEK